MLGIGILDKNPHASQLTIKVVEMPINDTYYFVNDDRFNDCAKNFRRGYDMINGNVDYQQKLFDISPGEAVPISFELNFM